MHPAPARLPRETRIDLFRGIALATIYINHVPGTIWEHFTSRNFGFSDAAEAFVLISGVSAALAYGRYFGPGSWWAGFWRCWGRAWTLYLVHIAVSVAVLGVVAGVLRFGGTADMILADNFGAFVSDPIGVFIGLPLLLHQFGYINILPLYSVLLLAAPVLLWSGRRWPRALLVLAVIVWGIAGYLRINFPNYPNPGGWFLNPLSWQLIFVFGLLTGLRLARGERLVPVRGWLIGLTGAYVLLSFFWMMFPSVREVGNAGMVWLSDLGAPRLVTNFNKTYLETPRLLHVLSLAYVLSAIPVLTRVSASRWLSPVTAMGRQALPVFAIGTVLSFAVRAILLLAEPAPAWLAAVVIWGGILFLMAFALIRERVLATMRGKSST